MPIKAVFFDLDGTLLDTAPDFVLTMHQLTDEYNVQRVPEEQIRQTVSNGSRALTTLAFNINEGDSMFDECKQRLLDIYYEHMGKHCQLYDGMEDLLNQIKSHQLYWGIITNKPHRFAQPIIDQLRLPCRPDLLLCPDHVAQAKPHPEALLLACKTVGCQANEAIYIGDHQRDIECGLHANSKTIAVNYGYIHENDNIHDWQADHIADHASHIWPIIQTYL